ncbi:hypothetical protein AAAC51_13650 [Priestia megaterium]
MQIKDIRTLIENCTLENAVLDKSLQMLMDHKKQCKKKSKKSIISLRRLIIKLSTCRKCTSELLTSLQTKQKGSVKMIGKVVPLTAENMQQCINLYMNVFTKNLGMSRGQRNQLEKG